jgi:hypothetical protein
VCSIEQLKALKTSRRKLKCGDESWKIVQDIFRDDEEHSVEEMMGDACEDEQGVQEERAAIRPALEQATGAVVGEMEMDDVDMDIR